MKLEALVEGSNDSFESLGIFEMAPGREMDSQSFIPYGTYEEQAEKFRETAQREYGRIVILVEVP